MWNYITHSGKMMRLEQTIVDLKIPNRKKQYNFINNKADYKC